MRILKYGLRSKNKNNNSNNNNNNSASFTDLNVLQNDCDGPPYDSGPMPIGERTSSTFASFNIFKKNKLKKLKSAPTSSSMVSLPKNHDFDPDSFDFNLKTFQKRSKKSETSAKPKNSTSYDPKTYEPKTYFKNNSETFKTSESHFKSPLQEKDSSATVKNDVSGCMDLSDREASNEDEGESDQSDDDDDRCVEDDTPNEDTSMGSLGDDTQITRKKRLANRKGTKPSIQSSTRSGVTTSSGCAVTSSMTNSGGVKSTKSQSHHSSGYSSAYSNSNYTSTGRHRASTCSTRKDVKS